METYLWVPPEPHVGCHSEAKVEEHCGWSLFSGPLKLLTSQLSFALANTGATDAGTGAMAGAGPGAEQEEEPGLFATEDALSTGDR